jgi:hypothetical protein
MGDKRTAYNMLAATPEENTPLGTPLRRWEDIIKVDV